METLALRYFNVFGPKQDSNSQYSAVIPKFITAIKADKQPVIYGDGTQSRDFTYVSNVVAANILAAESSLNSGTVMNCATHGQVKLNELVEKINNILGKNIKPIYSDVRAGDIKHSYAAIKLINEKLDFKPIIKFEKGIVNTISSISC